MRKLKILLTPDHFDRWSACNRCIEIKRNLTDFDIDIKGMFDNELFNNIEEVAKDYDFVHLHFTGSLECLYPFYQKCPEKLLITIINERSLLQEFEIDVEKANEMIYGCCGATSLSRKMADIYKLDYIPNGVNLEIFRSPKSIKVGYCGTMKVNKNVEVLERVCHDLGLQLVKASFDQKVPHEDMYQFYRQLDVFVHPSLTEASSNPVLEALAMNVPVIKTRVGNYHEFDGFVTFVEPTYESLYQALKRFNTRNLIQERFEWKALCYKYKLFYLRMAARQQQMIGDKND